MNRLALVTALKDLPLGLIDYLERTTSTNDDAMHWAEQGTPDLTLVVANEQTAGRGRLGRRWFTPAGAALAFSLVIRAAGQGPVWAYTALGALAVASALRQFYGLEPRIKWPNDVLLNGRKVCGVLVEAHWSGESLSYIILGIGVNITPSSVPPSDRVIFPATCVEDARLPAQAAVEPVELLRSILTHLLAWRARMDQAEFLAAWEEALVYRGQRIHLYSGAQGDPPRAGVLLGLNSQGNLRLGCDDGSEQAVLYGEIHLRPA